MKKRILAALLAVAMVAGVCTFASADNVPENTDPAPNAEATAVPTATADIAGPVLLFEDDFEGESTTIEMTVNGSAGITVDPTDPSNKVYNICDTSWGQFTSNAFIDGLDPTKEYTMKVDVIGDIGWMGLTKDGHWNASYFIAGCNPGYQDKYVIQATLPELQTWKTAIFKFTGLSVVKLTGQTQAAQGYMNGNLYIDNLAVYEGDMVADLTVTPTPVATEAPTVAPTAAVTVTPSSSATAAPTASPSTGTTTPKKKVTIKFNKKSVKIKKGQKATLKVTIKNAKKAAFSVDKKGKKVVKLSKKKAKSVVVTGKKKGKATITAKASGKKATCKVTVK